MERFHFHFSRRSLATLLSALERPDLTWRVIICGTAITALIVSVLSFLSYGWAAHSAVPIVTTKADNALSVKEIRSVIDLYKTKQKRFQELQVTRPKAPALGSEAGVEVENAVTEEPVIENPSTESQLPVQSLLQ